jgi:hypothetical protein
LPFGVEAELVVEAQAAELRVEARTMIRQEEQ